MTTAALTGLDRSTRLAVAARFVTNAGAEAAFFVGMWGKAAFEFDAGPGPLAVMTALIALASVVGNIAGGLLVDRTDARRVLIATEIALVPSVLSLILANDLTSLFAIGTVSWLLHGVEETAATSLPQALVDDDDALMRVNAVLEGAGWLAFVIGPAAGALLAGAVSVSSVFVLDAATSVVAIGLLAGVTLVRPGPTAQLDGGQDDDPATGTFAETLQGLRVAYRTPRIRLVMVIGSLIWFAFGAFIALEPLYFRDVLQTGPDAIGYVNSVFGAGMFVGSVLLARGVVRARFRTALLLSMLTGFGSIIYVGSSSITIVLVGAVAWSIPLGMLLPVLRTLAQQASPAGFTGRVMGAIAMQQNLTSVLPAAVTPTLAGAFGVQGVLIAGGMVPILAVPLLWHRITAHDRETEPTADSGDPTLEPAQA